MDFTGRIKLPMVLQTEAAECGLACLTMVANYHGHDVDLPYLRHRFSTSLRGINLARVMDIAAQLGLDSRPLRLELSMLSKLKRPSLLHWDLNHFVVLKSVTPRGIIIHDPAKGVRNIGLKELSEHFTGVALELAPTADFHRIQARQRISIRALTGNVVGLAPALAQILVFAVLLEVFTLTGPFYLQWVLDQVLVSADYDVLTLLGLGFIGVAIFRAIIAAIRSWAVTWLGATITVQWSSNLAGHLLRLPLDWFEKRHIGEMVASCTPFWT
jgi:ATP-binding cassette subfamily B protein RaxB